jgi:hypothetical protein
LVRGSLCSDNTIQTFASDGEGKSSWNDSNDGCERVGFERNAE